MTSSMGMSFATMTLAERPCWILLPFACRTGTEFQTGLKTCSSDVWQTASLLKISFLSSAHIGTLNPYQDDRLEACLRMTYEAAAVLSPEHSPRLRHTAAAQPPSNDNASQASYSPKQQPLLCMLCTRLIKAAMWHCASPSSSQGCGMLTRNNAKVIIKGTRVLPKSVLINM